MSIKFKKVELKAYPNLASIKPGLKVVALKGTDYEELRGEITEIKYGSEKETENDTILDIYVDFKEPKYSSIDHTHPHLNGTSIEQVIMGEDELGFLFEEDAPFFTTAEGKAVCPHCYEPMDKVTEKQYDDIEWVFNKETNEYEKDTAGGSEGKRCDKCNGEIEDFDEVFFGY